MVCISGAHYKQKSNITSTYYLFVNHDLYDFKLYANEVDPSLLRNAQSKVSLNLNITIYFFQVRKKKLYNLECGLVKAIV